MFEAALSDFKAQPLDGNDAHDLVARYEDLVDRIVSRYSTSVINDAFVQQAYALLARLVERWNLGGPTLHHDLFAGGGVMESVRPVRSLLALAGTIRGDPALLDLFKTRPPGEVWQQIERDSRFDGFRTILRRHFDEFGDRTFQELKLETPPAEDTPELIIELLRNYATTPEHGDGEPRMNATGSFPASIERREKAEKAIDAGLSGHPVRRAIFSLVLRRSRQMVAHREDLRLMRSRAFGMVKRIVRALGQRLTQAGLIDQPLDVFYLSIDEVTGAVRGASITRDLRALVTERRREYDVFRQWTPPSRVTARGIVLASVANAAGPPAPAAAAARELHGIACSAGRVTARARVVRTPEHHLDIRGEILVAPMTDPGWVFLMVPAGGLVVERGSILSHTAIIGRELGIPTVVGVADATSLIADGQLLEIDGSSGVVRLLD